MGNWGKVSELLNAKDKTERACMEHYVDLYLHSYGSVLPKVRIGWCYVDFGQRGARAAAWLAALSR
jgi:hypothetical protein